jgi:hypothetical protein
MLSDRERKTDKGCDAVWQVPQPAHLLQEIG